MKKIQYIYQLILPHWRYIIADGFFNIIAVLFSVFSLTMLIPFLGILFDNQNLVHEPMAWQLTTEALTHNFNYYLSKIIIEKGSANALITIGLLIAGTSMLKNIFIYIGKVMMSAVRTRTIEDLRNDLYTKTLDLPLGYYTNERKGDLLSKMTNDVLEVEAAITHALDIILRQPVTILVYLVSLIIMSPELTLFVAILLPIAGLIIGRIGKTLKNVSRNTQIRLGMLITILEETLSGMRIIKGFGAEKNMNKRFAGENKNYTNFMFNMWIKRELASPLSEFLGTIIVVVLMWYGGSLVLSGSGSLSSQEFIGYLVIFSQIINPAKAFSQAWYHIQRGTASLERLEDLLHADNPIKEKPDAVSVQEFKSKLEFKNVSFKYKDEYVLRNINLEIKKGQTVALVGQSGSGKSTLADLIPRFYDIEEGEILIDGVNIKEYKIADLRALLGIVSQESILFNDTAAANIAFGKPNASLDEIIYAAGIANARDFIEENPEKYDSNIGERGSRLSGGQRQRVSIARAVLKNPPIMILDEATSALDTESEKLVQSALDNLMKDRTAIIIAHRLSTIKNADIIYVVHEGQIVEHGSHNELLDKNGIYSKLHAMQS